MKIKEIQKSPWLGKTKGPKDKGKIRRYSREKPQDEQRPCKTESAATMKGHTTAKHGERKGENESGMNTN